MEPEERLTKRERRERARRERKEQAQVKEKQGSQRRLLTITGTAVALVGIAALIWVTRPAPAETGITIAAAEAEDAVLEAGCQRTEIPTLPDNLIAPHIDEATAPPPTELYPFLPTHHGPHFGSVHPHGAFDEPVDERLTTHNLEHGSVVAWYDPDALSASEIDALEDWAEARNQAGFGQRGAGIIVSPYFQPLDSGQAVAYRGWFVAVDCDGFNETAADTVLALHYGTRGQGPEASAFAPYPSDVLDFDAPPTEDPFGGVVDDVDEPVDEPADDPDDEPAEDDEPDEPEDEGADDGDADDGDGDDDA